MTKTAEWPNLILLYCVCAVFYPVRKKKKGRKTNSQCIAAHDPPPHTHTNVPHLKKKLTFFCLFFYDLFLPVSTHTYAQGPINAAIGW